MNSTEGVSILELPLAKAGMSAAFVKAAAVQQYFTLKQLLAIPLTELVKKEWITHEMWEELLKKMTDFPKPTDIV